MFWQLTDFSVAQYCTFTALFMQSYNASYSVSNKHFHIPIQWQLSKNPKIIHEIPTLGIPAVRHSGPERYAFRRVIMHSGIRHSGPYPHNAVRRLQSFCCQLMNSWNLWKLGASRLSIVCTWSSAAGGDRRTLGLEMLSRTGGLNTLRWSALRRGLGSGWCWRASESKRDMLAEGRRTEASGRELGLRSESTDSRRCRFVSSHGPGSLQARHGTMTTVSSSNTCA